MHSNTIKNYKNFDISPPTEKQLIRLVFDIVKQSTDVEKDELGDFLEANSDSEEPPEKVLKTLNFYEQLEKASLESMQAKPKKSFSTSSLAETIKAEHHLFKLNNTKGPMLEFAYSSLLSIHGSSVEFRSRLNDDTLNVMCYLKTFFQNNI